MVDLVSYSFIKSLGLEPYIYPSYQHEIPVLEGVRETRPRTYGFFHLRMALVDRFGRSFSCIRPFLAVDRDARDSQVLLGRPTLKDYRINILNSKDLWEFKRNPKVTRISPTKFAREIALSTPYTLAYQVKLYFRPFKASDNDDDMPGIDDPPDVSDTDLVNVPKRLRQRYRDFFSLVKAAKPTPY